MSGIQGAADLVDSTKSLESEVLPPTRSEQDHDSIQKATGRSRTATRARTTPQAVLRGAKQAIGAALVIEQVTVGPGEGDAPPLRGLPLNVVGRNSTYVAGVLPAAALRLFSFVGPALWALYQVSRTSRSGNRRGEPALVGIETTRGS